ncbi:unnamed protein product [Effrenium voratum]|nr:unnamed protein product [Effrenium voratum]
MGLSSAFGCLLGAASAPSASGAAGAGALRVVPQRKLFVSEPNPRMFGNGPNEKGPAWTNTNWLKSRFHFNFAEYGYGPDNFGVLRVMNDDLVQPKRGFGTHPHRDMEIMTFIIHGKLTHKDSMGTEETLGRGGVQFMTAGTGIRHSEHNLQEEALRFVQCWVVPRRRGLRPAYGSMAGTPEAEEARRNQWAHVASDAEGQHRTPVKVQQDCNVFVAELQPGKKLPALQLEPGRQAYMLCVEGSVQLEKAVQLEAHDACEVKGPTSLEPTAGSKGGFLLLFEMGATMDGRQDL